MMKRNTRETVVSEHVALDFVDDEGRRAAVEADMIYDQRDPFAMSIVFQTVPPVTWTFSRDLLMSGMYEPTGDGDVHVWPCLSTDGQAVVIFEFSSPDGEVLVQAGMRECSQFVSRMVGSVPQGEEADYMDLDVTIGQLLSDPDVQVES